jgi:hypothetical protein
MTSPKAEQTALWRAGPGWRPTVPEYEPGLLAQKHSATSVEAAKLVRGTAGRNRVKVYRYLLERGDEGSTDEEGEIALHFGGNSYRPRRIELQNAGLVVDTGRTRRTTSNRRAVVWKAVRPEGA